MMKISISSLLSIFLVLLIYFSNPPWFIWGINYYLISIAVLAIVIVLFFSNQSTSRAFLYGLPLLTVAITFFFFFKGITEIRFSTLLFFIMYVSLFFIDDKYKIKAFNLLVLSLTTILSVSLTFWFIHNFVFNLSFAKPLYYLESMGKGDLVFDNFLFFIQPKLDYFRFYSVFDEPGVLGLLCTIVLFVNNYNFKNKYNIIILIGGLFTFSLAFYFLTLIGYIYVSLKQNRYKGILLAFLLSFFSLPIFYSIDAFRLSIFNRFSNINTALTERSEAGFNVFYSDFTSSNSVYYGKSLLFFKDNPGLNQGQSYKVFIIEYGFFGLLLLILLYLFLIDYKKANLYVLGLLAIFVLSFLQRPFMFTAWQIVLFSISLPILYKGKENESSFQNI